MTQFSLPPATTLGTVRLQVSDLERSVDYYERVIGLVAVKQGARRADLTAAGGAMTIVELCERRLASPVPKRGRLGLYHFAILLPNRAALGRFLSHLAESGTRAGMSDHLVSEAVYLTDPDGLGIEVYRDRPRDSWQRVDGQLATAINPLDRDAVIESAGGERGTGMPAGTTLGHVHLHVGDIGEAATFYSDGLGFEKTVWSYPGALFMAAGGYHHHLGTNTWAAGAAPATDSDSRLLQWQVVVPTAADARAVATNLKAGGHPVSAAGNAWRATDPWGTTVEIIAAGP